MDDLREFLVSLGYEVKGEDRWKVALDNAAKLAVGMAKALASAASALSAVVVKTTMALDDANWSATKAGTSAANLKSLAYALGQTGKSSASAGAMLSSFAATLRTLPAAESLIRGLGVQTRVNGSLRDTQALLLDVVDALNRNTNYVQAASLAEQLGISEGDYADLRKRSGQVREFIAQNEAMAKRMGLDRDALAGQSTIAMQGWRASLMQLSIAVDTLMMSIAPILAPLVDRLDAWINANSDKITMFLRNVVEAFGALVAAVADLIGQAVHVGDRFGTMAEKSKGLMAGAETIATIWIAVFAARMLGLGMKVRVGIAALVATFLLGRKMQSDTVIPGLTGNTELEGGGSRGFWGRIGGALGIGRGSVYPSVDIGTAVSGPMLDRGKFAEELRDPAVRARLMAYTEAEVGSQSYDERLAFMESTFNRAAARGQSLAQTLSGSYFPQITHSRAASIAGDPRLEAKYREMVDKVMAGSNITHGATGNESGGVRSGGAPILFYGKNGERFVLELPDIAWWKTQQQILKERAAREQRAREEEEERRKRYIPSMWERRADLFPSRPLIGEPDEMSVTTDRRTKIVVHGDPNPHDTATKVGTEQKRINSDMIASTERAFA